MGVAKSYIIIRVGQQKSYPSVSKWVGGSKKDPKYAYVYMDGPLHKGLLGPKERTKL